jgi:hypothetical protein
MDDDPTLADGAEGFGIKICIAFVVIGLAAFVCAGILLLSPRSEAIDQRRTTFAGGKPVAVEVTRTTSNPVSGTVVVALGAIGFVLLFTGATRGQLHISAGGFALGALRQARKELAVSEAKRESTERVTEAAIEHIGVENLPAAVESSIQEYDAAAQELAAALTESFERAKARREKKQLSYLPENAVPGASAALRQLRLMNLVTRVLAGSPYVVRHSVVQSAPGRPDAMAELTNGRVVAIEVRLLQRDDDFSALAAAVSLRAQITRGLKVDNFDLRDATGILVLNRIPDTFARVPNILSCTLHDLGGVLQEVAGG